MDKITAPARKVSQIVADKMQIAADAFVEYAQQVYMKRIPKETDVDDSIIVLLLCLFIPGLGIIFAGAVKKHKSTIVTGSLQLVMAYLLLPTVIGFVIFWLWSIYWAYLIYIDAHIRAAEEDA